MKIVIDIDDEDYKRIKDIPDVFNSLTSRAYKAIKYGTPLPEHHGRLIDADKLHMVYCNDNCGERKCVDAMDRCVFIDAVLDAPTIIEGSDSE